MGSTRLWANHRLEGMFENLTLSQMLAAKKRMLACLSTNERCAAP